MCAGSSVEDAICCILVGANIQFALCIAHCALCNFAIYCIEMAGCGMLTNPAKDPLHLNSIWTLCVLSLTLGLSSTPPILTINIIKDTVRVLKDMMTIMRDLPAGAGHYLDLWSHQLTRDVAPLAIETNLQYSTNTEEYKI